MTPTGLADLNRALNTYQINTPQPISQFLAQTAAESGKGRDIVEGGTRTRPAG